MMLLSDDTTIGQKLPRRIHRVDQALVDRYASVSGDLNPLHTDTAFAATTLYGRTIAHGMMTLAFVSAALQAWVGSAWVRSGVVDITFLAPVFPNEDVEIDAELVERDDDGVIGLHIECKASGRIVAVARARATMKDEVEAEEAGGAS